MAEGVLLSARAIEQLRRDHRRLQNQVRNLESRLRYAHSPSPVQQGYTGITGTSTAYPSYPTSGSVVPVNLERWTFTETSGGSGITYNASTRAVLASTLDGSTPAQGTHVIIDRIQGSPGRRWWIRPSVSNLIAARITSTGTNAAANTVTAELGSLTYTTTVGRQTLVFTADSPQSTITVHEMSGHGPPPRTNDVVLVAAINGKYQIVKTTARYRLKATAAQTIAANSSGLVNIWVNGAQTTRQETAYANWMVSSSIANGKRMIISWFDDEQKWVIVSVEC